MHLKNNREQSQNKDQFQLPKTRKKSFVLWIDKQPAWVLFVNGLFCYIGVVMFFSLAEWFFVPEQVFICSSIWGFGDLLYFNFVSILSIGYGDIAPIGVLRGFTILEALLGLVVYSSFISIFIIKLMLPNEHTIVFSKYAYFCTAVDSFMIIYLNTTTRKITNLETAWYFKLNEDWKTMPPSKVPFITTSVQTFYLEFKQELGDFAGKLHYKDSLRVSLTGNLGMSSYSTSIQYDLKDILIIEDRSELTKYDGFYRVDNNLATEEFVDKFHYRPENAKSLSDYISSGAK